MLITLFSYTAIMKKQNKKSKWFIKVRSSYLPNSGAGWLTYIPFIAYLTAVPFIAYTSTDSLPLTILITVPNWVAATIIMTYVATVKS
jgi:hypothetical protein